MSFEVCAPVGTHRCRTMYTARIEGHHGPVVPIRALGAATCTSPVTGEPGTARRDDGPPRESAVVARRTLGIVDVGAAGCVVVAILTMRDGQELVRISVRNIEGARSIRLGPRRTRRLMHLLTTAEARVRVSVK